MIVGTAVAAYGAYQQGQAAKASAQFNAQVANQNAQAARAQSLMQQQQQQREQYKRLGAIRAAQGASGGTMEGSALDVLGETAAQGELERQNIAYRGEMAARGYGNTASLDLFGGKQAAQAGTLTAIGTVAKGAGSAYGAMSTPAASAGTAVGADYSGGMGRAEGQGLQLKRT
jgi:hypothetical protein